MNGEKMARNGEERGKRDERLGVTASSKNVSLFGAGARLRGVAVRKMQSGLRGWQAWRVDTGDAGSDEKPAGPLETQFDATRRAHAILDKLQLPVPVRVKRD